jgi:hypothetical protein
MTIYLFGTSGAGKSIVAPNARTPAVSIAESTALHSGIPETAWGDVILRFGSPRSSQGNRASDLQPLGDAYTGKIPKIESHYRGKAIAAPPAKAKLVSIGVAFIQ